MNKKYVALFLFVAVVFQGFSQKKIGDYTYIVVPPQFEFVKGKDTYRLNTLTRYQLRQYGYSAVFTQELPKDLTRCDVLYLDATGGGSFVFTKMNVVLKDCNEFVVFRTKEGKSKQKEYKDAYQEAMRDALLSFELADEEDIQTPDPDSSTTAAVNAETSKANAKGVPKTITESMKKKKPPVTEIPDEVAPKGKVYRYKEYRIIETDKDVTVLHNRESIGKLISTSQKNTYLVNTSQFSGIAYKTEDGFEIERQMEGRSELVVMKFVRNDN